MNYARVRYKIFLALTISLIGEKRNLTWSGTVPSLACMDILKAYNDGSIIQILWNYNRNSSANIPSRPEARIFLKNLSNDIAIDLVSDIAQSSTQV